MSNQTLRVRARGTALAADYKAAEHSVRRFIGRSLKVVQEDLSGDGNHVAGWVPIDEAVEIDARAEHMRHVSDGDLWAADEATALACGVKFDPTFGGEVKPAAKPTKPAPLAEKGE